LPIAAIHLLRLLEEDSPMAMAEEMTLTINGKKKISNPSDDDILNALEALDTRSGEAFIVLDSDDMTYMQTAGDHNVGFELEYQEGTVKRHYRASRTDIRLDEIAQALCAYRDGRPDWKKQFDFEDFSW
jgi:hypothetical protein